MTALKIIAYLHESGIELRAEGDRLRFAPQSAVSRNMMETLKTHKSELLAILNAKSQDAGDIDPSEIAACPRCGLLEQWQSLIGDWRCLRCEPMDATYQLLAHIQRIQSGR